MKKIRYKPDFFQIVDMMLMRTKYAPGKRFSQVSGSSPGLRCRNRVSAKH